MPSDPVHVSRKEFSSGEVLDQLDDGRRVIVSVDVLGVGTDVVLRKTGEKYVCDTGVKLMTYEDREGMRRCIERLRLTDPE